MLGQGGKSHINTHSSVYLTTILAAMGYAEDTVLTAQFRSDGESHYDQHAWFKESIQVFRRIKNAC